MFKFCKVWICLPYSGKHTATLKNYYVYLQDGKHIHTLQNGYVYHTLGKHTAALKNYFRNVENTFKVSLCLPS